MYTVPMLCPECGQAWPKRVHLSGQFLHAIRNPAEVCTGCELALEEEEAEVNTLVCTVVSQHRTRWEDLDVALSVLGIACQ